MRSQRNTAAKARGEQSPVVILWAQQHLSSVQQSNADGSQNGYRQCPVA